MGQVGYDPINELKQETETQKTATETPATETPVVEKTEPSPVPIAQETTPVVAETKGATATTATPNESAKFYNVLGFEVSTFEIVATSIVTMSLAVIALLLLH